MKFVECAFIVTDEPKIGGKLQSIYPKECLSLLTQDLPSVVFPHGVKKRSTFIRFVVSKTTESSINNVEIKTPLFDALVERKKKGDAHSEMISNNSFLPVIAFLYNASIHIGMLSTENGCQDKILWQCSINPNSDWRCCESSKTAVIAISERESLLLQFWSSTLLNDFVLAYKKIQLLYHDRMQLNTAKGVIPMFSKVYYGIGVSFDYKSKGDGMIGIVSSSIYTFSAVEFFLLRILSVQSGSVARRLYVMLNEANLPITLQPAAEILTSVRQLSYSFFPKYSTLDSYRMQINVEWLPKMKIPFYYSQLIGSTSMTFPYESDVSQLVSIFERDLFVIFDAIFSGYKVILVSQLLSMETLQNLVLILANLMAPFIHDIYHHILLISDPISMKDLVLSTQTDMFFIASTCIGSVLDFPSIFDLCYMIDKKSMFVSSRVPQELISESRLVDEDYRLITTWRLETHNELQLFNRIQLYLECIVSLIVQDPHIDTLRFTVYENRVQRLKESKQFPYLEYCYRMQRSKLSSTTSSNEGLSARFEKEGISVQTIYDSVLLLKWKEKWSIQELEATYSALELLTRDNSNVLHFINALYKFDVQTWLALQL
ncbi:hypothetical protein WA171_003480 [Blastocystis sp. BT1]